MVLKVITIYNKDTDSMEEVLLEELQVFKVLYFKEQRMRVNFALQLLICSISFKYMMIRTDRCCRSPSGEHKNNKLL